MHDYLIIDYDGFLFILFLLLCEWIKTLRVFCDPRFARLKKRPNCTYQSRHERKCREILVDG